MLLSRSAVHKNRNSKLSLLYAEFVKHFIVKLLLCVQSLFWSMSWFDGLLLLLATMLFSVVKQLYVRKNSYQGLGAQLLYLPYFI